MRRVSLRPVAAIAVIPRPVSEQPLIQIAVRGGLLLTNLPWLAAVVSPLVYGVYAAVVLALYVVVLWASDRAPARARAFIQRLLPLGVGLAVIVQLGVLWMLRPRVHIVMDRDSALLTWLATLGRGDFPYANPTELGNPISAFPLVPEMAFPFVLLGNIGYLEVASFVSLAALLWWRYRANPPSRFLSLAVLASSPLVYLEVLTRSELIANSLLLMLLVGFIESKEQELISGRSRARTVVILGVGLGCLMATRVGFFPALGVVFVYLLRRLSLRAGLAMCSVATLTFAAIVGPFLLWNPAVFLTYAPLGVNLAKLQVSPLAGTLWPAATGCAVLASGLLARRAADLFVGVAVVMLVVTLGTYLSGFIDVSYFQLSFIPLLFSLPTTRVQPRSQSFAAVAVGPA